LHGQSRKHILSVVGKVCLQRRCIATEVTELLLAYSLPRGSLPSSCLAVNVYSGFRASCDNIDWDFRDFPQFHIFPIHNRGQYPIRHSVTSTDEKKITLNNICQLYGLFNDSNNTSHYRCIALNCGIVDE
jgi:hypothetical protein